MKRYLISKMLLVSLCLYLPVQGMAWGVLGHRIIGEIADSYLSPRAKIEVSNILGNESLAMSSNWADFVKSDTAYSYLYNWHFINLDAGMSRQQVMDYLDKDTATDAFTKIKFLSAALKSKILPKALKQMYLRLLVHIVGDIHQPLHVGRFQDLGGNKIKLLWFKDSANLHQVWDEKLINFQQLSYTEYTQAINHTASMQRKLWNNEPLSEWIYQSYQLAQSIYEDIEQRGRKLDYKYNYDYVETLNQQLLKGGVHLAALLNEIFG